MRAIRCLLAAVLAAGIVSVVAAQPGTGGFGRGGGGDTYTSVLTNKALQEEVKITDAQKEKFKKIADSQKEATAKITEGLKDKFADAKGDKDKFKELFEGMQKDMAKVTADTRKELDAELTADQKKRLKQISIQVVGLRIFNDPEAKGMGGMGGFGGGGVSESQKALMKEVQGALKLSEAQQKTVKGVVADYTKESTEISNEVYGKGKDGFKNRQDPEKQAEFAKKDGKIRKEAWAKVEEALDDTQKKTWKDLVGDAFDTSKLRTAPPKKD